MRRLLLLVALTALDASGAALSRERVVLHTTLGDLVIALYPKAAPNHYAQILRLVRAGVYDRTPFVKIDRDYWLQIDGVMHRRTPLTDEQRAMVHTLKAEFNDEPHRYGTVTMAHNPNDPDSAETSFLFLLRDMPEMNRKFTVVGEVVDGKEILEVLRMVPADFGHKPLQPTDILRAEVVDSPEAVRGLALKLEAPAMEPVPPGLGRAALVLFGIGTLLWLLSWFARGGLVRAVGLVAMLGGFFLLFALLTPAAATSKPLAVGLFAGAVAMFKLMTFFERRPT